VLRVQAEAAAVAFVQEKSAQRDSVAIRLTAERESYKNMKQNLTLTTADLLTIIWLTAVQASPAPQLLSVDVPKACRSSRRRRRRRPPRRQSPPRPPGVQATTAFATTDAATTATPVATPTAAVTTTTAVNVGTRDDSLKSRQSTCF
jgi:hypothetical protein